MARKIWKKTPSQTSLLVRLYNEQPYSTEMLPYTKEIDKILKEFRSKYPSEKVSVRDIYRTLTNLRKAGKLLRKTKNVAVCSEDDDY